MFVEDNMENVNVWEEQGPLLYQDVDYYLEEIIQLKQHELYLYLLLFIMIQTMSLIFFVRDLLELHKCRFFILIMSLKLTLSEIQRMRYMVVIIQMKIGLIGLYDLKIYTKNWKYIKFIINAQNFTYLPSFYQ